MPYYFFISSINVSTKPTPPIAIEAIVKGLVDGGGGGGGVVLNNPLIKSLPASIKLGANAVAAAALNTPEQ